MYRYRKEVQILFEIVGSNIWEERVSSRPSLVDRLTETPFKAPTKVSHHANAPATLIPGFHLSYVLVESLPLLFTKFTKVFRKIIKMGMQEMDFNTHASTHSSVV